MRKNDKRDYLTILIMWAVMMCLIWAATVLIAQFAKAGEPLFVTFVVCNDKECVDKYLAVPPDVNEVQCAYTAHFAVTKWVMDNMPGWKLKSWKCTHAPEYTL